MLELILEALGQGLALFAGAAGVPLIQYLKRGLGIESDQAAIGLTGVVSALLSVIVAAAAGQIGVEMFASLDGAFGALPTIFSIAVTVFKMLGGNERL